MYGAFTVNAGDEKFVLNFSLGNLEGKEDCTDRHIWADNIQMNLRNVGCEWTGFNSLINVSMVGSCLHGYKLSGFMINKASCPLHHLGALQQ